MLPLVHRSLANSFAGLIRCSALDLLTAEKSDACANGTGDNARLRGCSRVDWYIYWHQ